MSRVRLLLADDHTLVLEGIRRILENDFDLVGTAKDGRSLLIAIQELKPDIVLLDITMPLLNGIDAARQIPALSPGSKIIFLTMHSDRDYVIEAFRAGASGYLLKWSAEEELATAIRHVTEGKTYLTPLLPESWLSQAKKHFINPTCGGELTQREREVLQLVAEGRSAKEIATILNLSVKTAEFHKYRIMQKLQLHTTAELTKYAVQHRLISL